MTDNELTKYATEFRAAIIGDASSAWWCAGISAPLCSAFLALGQTVEIVECDLGYCTHVFLRLPNGRVLDPTADQFNWCSRVELPGVYLGEPSDIHQAPEPYDGQCWDELLIQFRRLCPSFEAREVGKMVRTTLASLPAGMVELPELMYG